MVKRYTTDKPDEAEFIVPMYCLRQVDSSTTGLRLGFCTRERGHQGRCSHLIDRRHWHLRHKQSGLYYYLKPWDYRQDGSYETRIERLIT